MRSLLIVSPHFPPTNGADMHRVRTSLPHYAEFGWEPRVLAVEPRAIEQSWNDDLLLESFPSTVPVHRVGALPIRWTRPLGLGAIGLRAWPQLYRAGCREIRERPPDLIFFSTTAFPAMTLGRVWRKRFGIPYVLDMQDPWVPDQPTTDPVRSRGFKHRLMRRLHRAMEPYAMRDAGGLLSVSPAYIETLHRRYPRLRSRPAAVLGFGASVRDFEVVRAHPQPNPYFQPGDGLAHGVYVGRGGSDMAPALRIIFKALRQGLEHDPAAFGKVRLHFVGTDYAPADRACKTVEPIAKACGVAAHVQEHPQRVPYFSALQLLRDADFLIVPGSDDPQYTASKIYPCILAKRPLLSVFHEKSSVVPIVRSTDAGDVVTFASGSDAQRPAEHLLLLWKSLLKKLPFTPVTNWTAFEPYTARQMTLRQCELFDLVFTNHRDMTGNAG